MNIIIVAMLLLVGRCESFEVGGGQELEVDLRVVKDANTRLIMGVEGEKKEDTLIVLKNGQKEVVKTFKNESNVAMSFVPVQSEDYLLQFSNLGKNPVIFSLERPETNEGALASQAEMNLSKKIEGNLQLIVKSQISLLGRQQMHLEKAKRTKSWIKKLSVLELILCVLVLYYVHCEVVKTFYSTKKV